MIEKVYSSTPIRRPGRIVTAAIYFLYAAVVIRTMVNQNIHTRLPIYLGLEFLYLVLFLLAQLRTIRRSFWRHTYFVFQSILVLILIVLRPRFDFIVVLYVLLSFQAILLFPDWEGWIWVAALALLTGIPLMVALGALQGLSLALMPISIGIVFAAYVAVTQEIEAGLQKRQALLAELQRANQQLTVSSIQVEELTAIQERNRLARELHDSVSQTMFSISLNTHSARILMERDPQRVRPQLELLQTLTHNALDEMRSLISELIPKQH